MSGVSKEFPHRVFLKKKRYLISDVIEKFLNDNNIIYFKQYYDSPGPYLRFKTLDDLITFEKQFPL